MQDLSFGARAAITGALMLLGVGLAACEEQGPAEKAGEAIDESAEKLGDAVEEATE